MRCCGCDAPMAPGLAEWHFECASCGYEAARLAPGINDAARQSMIDEDARESALRPLRERNFRALVELLAQHSAPERRALLDVGAGHGWFAAAAAARFDVTALEPDRAMCARARERGVALTEGYFPESLGPDARFDVIVFNDVFEHIPELSRILAACERHLRDGGLILFNLPSNRGLFYRTSRALMRLGVRGPFERMWQVTLPSPHLHYFRGASLLALARRHGFAHVHTGELPSMTWRGLYARMSYVTGTSRLRILVGFCAAAAAFPFTRWFPSDIAVVLVRKGSDPG